MPRKKCIGPCGQMLPATTEFFHRNKHTKDGLLSRCKECASKDKKARHSRPEGKAQLRTYRLRPEVREQESKRRGRPEYLERQRAYDRRPEKREMIDTRTRTRRARKKAIPGTHTAAQIQDLLKRQRHTCYYCHGKFQKAKGKYSYHIDHTFPLSRVASTTLPANDISYLVLTCPTCNLRKGNRFPWEFFEGGRML